MQSSALNRRSFIARMGLGTVSSWLGASVVQTQVAVTAEELRGPGSLRLRIADYPVLQQDSGSIRIGTSSIIGNYPAGLFDPIIINRAPGGVFYVMSARCPHEGCAVGKYAAVNERMVCPCHGSQFRIDGSYVEGPANGPLWRFQTSLKDGVLLAEIPDMPYRLSFNRVSPQRDRLALEFIAFEHIRYEVHYRESMEVEPAAVPFALSPNGALNQTEYAGTSDWVTFYVPMRGPAGIYSVAMKISQV